MRERTGRRHRHGSRGTVTHDLGWINPGCWLLTLGRVRLMFHRLRWFIQRGRRGWSDDDLWNLDYYLASVLAGSLRALDERGVGFPCRKPDPTGVCPRSCDDCRRSWSVELRKNVRKFQAVAGRESAASDWDEETRIYTEGQEAMAWLAQNWRALWL